MKEIFVFAAAILVTAAQQYDYTLTLEGSVDMQIGPEDASYCVLFDPSGVTVHEGFGPCRLRVDRVTEAHQGVWRARVGRPGHIVTDTLRYTITTLPRPTVVTSLDTSSEPDVYIHCSVRTPYKFKMCKLRDPQSNVILLPAPSAQAGRYSDHETSVSIQSDGLNYIDCGLKITNPESFERGVWRCAIETDRDTFYGFFTLKWPWSSKHMEIVDVGAFESVLVPVRNAVTVKANHSFELACHMSTSLDYCYFRSNDGAIYNVAPGVSNSEFEYVGSGLDAGECGIRLRSANIEQTGPWTCHAYLPNNPTLPVQEAWINVRVQGLRVSLNCSSLPIRMTATVANSDSDGPYLEYCRFVRSDGYSFTTGQTNTQYSVQLYSQLRMCEFQIRDPYSYDYNHDYSPWFVAVRLYGQSEEMYVMAHFREYECGLMGRPDAEDPPQPPPQQQPNGSYTFYLVWRTFFAFLILGFVFILIGLMVQDKNRRWVSRKSADVRNSFRRDNSNQPSEPINERQTVTSPEDGKAPLP